MGAEPAPGSGGVADTMSPRQAYLGAGCSWSPGPPAPFQNGLGARLERAPAPTRSACAGPCARAYACTHKSQPAH